MSGGSGVSRTWVEVVGSLGVIASLVFVGLEVRQNTAAVRGATYQAIADASQEQTLWFADNEEIRHLQVRTFLGDTEEDFTPEENLMLTSNYAMVVRRVENVFVQVREGLVEEEAVLRFRPAGNFFTPPRFREYWEVYAPQLEPEFRAYFEREFLEPGTDD